MQNNMQKLSIIIPVYNEKDTLLKILTLVEQSKISIEKEVVLVDDASTDGTVEILKSLDQTKYKIIFSEKNEGKGASVKKGFQNASGDLIIIQDADLEYDPNEYERLLKPILDGKADVVFSSRFLGNSTHRVLYFWHYLGNKFLTVLSDIFTGLNLSDMESCYKVFKREVLDSFVNELESKRFGIEPELVARCSRGRWRIYEVGVSYYGRTYAEGKKIGWKDGFSAILTILKFGIFRK
ncbi:MAG: glycosyltransferase family 2 protein [Patescibacteria group bacterium]